jgi:hypothetical protein
MTKKDKKILKEIEKIRNKIAFTISKDEMLDLYWKKLYTLDEMARLYNVGEKAVRKLFFKYNIPIRNNAESKRAKLLRETKFEK